MSDWTARIDALLAERPDPNADEYGDECDWYADIGDWYKRRLALAAERLKEPHGRFCALGGYVVQQDGSPMGTVKMLPCTCGLVADVLKILEGK